MKTIELGAVHLNVNNLTNMREYYEHLGLTGKMEDGKVVLYADDRPLLVLHETHKTRRHEVGLYHFAIKVPTRGDFGDFLYHAAKTRIPVTGFSDHYVSEAIYLTDPEGNGIEVYWDRPQEKWMKDGTLHMSTEVMDIDGVLKSRYSNEFIKFPKNTVLGHIHLHVLDLEASSRHYKKTLGLAKMFDYPSAGFYSRDGYHHHIAMNLWLPGSPKEKEDHYPGIHSFTLYLEPSIYDALYKTESYKMVHRDPSNILYEVHRGFIR
ncbi:VOC family protein [Proteiniclasticum sp.]|uniref:VOC family protein n=1 Tax=Proteiniclasticum sp. TaxID=2053595 RepID=UPI0028A01ED0|nr:VOC family protein [Proteiniclasticum sp.]